MCRTPYGCRGAHLAEAPGGIRARSKKEPINQRTWGTTLTVSTAASPEQARYGESPGRRTGRRRGSRLGRDFSGRPARSRRAPDPAAICRSCGGAHQTERTPNPGYDDGRPGVGAAVRLGCRETSSGTRRLRAGQRLSSSAWLPAYEPTSQTRRLRRAPPRPRIRERPDPEAEPLRGVPRRGPRPVLPPATRPVGGGGCSPADDRLRCVGCSAHGRPRTGVSRPARARA